MYQKHNRLKSSNFYDHKNGLYSSFEHLLIDIVNPIIRKLYSRKCSKSEYTLYLNDITDTVNDVIIFSLNVDNVYTKIENVESVLKSELRTSTTPINDKLLNYYRLYDTLYIIQAVNTDVNINEYSIVLDIYLTIDIE